jgi:hypothetical protein
MRPTGDWAWARSTDSEDWHGRFRTKHEAVEAAHQEGPGEVWLDQVVEVEVADIRRGLGHAVLDHVAMRLDDCLTYHHFDVEATQELDVLLSESLVGWLRSVGEWPLKDWTVARSAERA